MTLPIFNRNTAQAAQSAPSNKVALKECTYPLGIGDTALLEVVAQCGTLDVPQNRADASGKMLTLSFVILPPTRADAKGLPIFHLEGGPGGSAIKLWGQSWYAAYLSFRETHPVVLIDQRGIGKSASLQCTEFTLKSFDDLKDGRPDAEIEPEITARFKDCLERLSRNYDPQYFTSDAMADDIDAVRAALGYDQILLFGNSYGTWLAQYYLKRHGDKAAGVVLDSVVGPWNNFGLDVGPNGQAALDTVIKLCEADAQCNKTYPNLTETFVKALDRLRQSPANTATISGVTGKSYGAVITLDKFRQAMFSLLYNSGNTGAVPQAIADAARGTYTYPGAVLATNAEQADLISQGLYTSVICSEMAAFYTDELARSYAKDTLLFGTVDEQVKSAQAQQKICKNWSTAKLTKDDVAPIRSDRPVLILSGNFDPVTPIKYGEETLKRMSNGTLVTFPYQGHGVIINSACAQSITLAFLNNPTAKVDSSCATKDIPPLFMGAVTVPLAPYTDPAATFTGNVPKGWKADQVDVNTFFTSPDGLMFAAAGVYKNMDVKTARDTFLKAIAARYGVVLPQQELTQNVIILQITVVAHSMVVPGSNAAYQGILYLQPDGKNVKVGWLGAPSVYLQAASIPILPALVTIRAK